jgi:hypothetical protein
MTIEAELQTSYSVSLRCLANSRQYIREMASPDSCKQCGFVWSAVAAREIPDRLRSATQSFVAVLRHAGDQATVRPTDERWSILEYGAHLRDVLISIRERIIAASIQDQPTGSPLYRDERVSLGFYQLDTSAQVADELDAMSNLFVRTFESVPPGFERREFIYSPVTPTKVTILWAGAQALHECEHHLGDARENLKLLNPE